jgi:ABC-2 type transport system ATP-binding protein
VQYKELFKERQLKIIVGQMSLIRLNGASKTSLIRCLMNLLHIDSGEIRLFGKTHIVATSEIKQKIGFVYDEITFMRIFL